MCSRLVRLTSKYLISRRGNARLGMSRCNARRGLTDRINRVPVRSDNRGSLRPGLSSLGNRVPNLGANAQHSSMNVLLDTRLNPWLELVLRSRHGASNSGNSGNRVLKNIHNLMTNLTTTPRLENSGLTHAPPRVAKTLQTLSMIPSHHALGVLMCKLERALALGRLARTCAGNGMIFK